MDPLDPLTEIINSGQGFSPAIALERIIWAMIGVFFLGAISRSITNSMRSQNWYQFWLRMLLVIDLEIAPKKKTPIIAQIILSKAIAGEKPWPELIISVSGSKGSKF